MYAFAIFSNFISNCVLCVHGQVKDTYKYHHFNGQILMFWAIVK